MFVLKILEKIKETRLMSCQGSVKILKKMVTYQKQLSKQTQKLEKVNICRKK